MLALKQDLLSPTVYVQVGHTVLVVIYRLFTLFWALYIYTVQWLSVYFCFHGNKNVWKIQI